MIVYEKFLTQIRNNTNPFRLLVLFHESLGRDTDGFMWNSFRLEIESLE